MLLKMPPTVSYTHLDVYKRQRLDNGEANRVKFNISNPIELLD